MGSRSKHKQGGAFGSHILVKAITKKQVTVEKEVMRKGKPVTVQAVELVDVPYIIGVKRPNRGRSTWKHRKVGRRGFRGLKMGDLGKHTVKVVRTDISDSVTKRGFFKRVFQKKGE